MSADHADNGDLWPADSPGPVCVACQYHRHDLHIDLFFVPHFGLMACDCPDLSHIDPEEADCTCARDGSASICPVHTQADFDAQTPYQHIDPEEET